MKQVIDWFEIPVRDLPRAQVFYETVCNAWASCYADSAASMSWAIFWGASCGA